jgi:FtsZ-binding cell division protein ZapB
MNELTLVDSDRMIKPPPMGPPIIGTPTLSKAHVSRVNRLKYVRSRHMPVFRNDSRKRSGDRDSNGARNAKRQRHANSNNNNKNNNNNDGENANVAQVKKMRDDEVEIAKACMARLENRCAQSKRTGALLKRELEEAQDRADAVAQSNGAQMEKLRKDRARLRQQRNLWRSEAQRLDKELGAMTERAESAEDRRELSEDRERDALAALGNVKQKLAVAKSVVAASDQWQSDRQGTPVAHRHVAQRRRRGVRRFNTGGDGEEEEESEEESDDGESKTRLAQYECDWIELRAATDILVQRMAELNRQCAARKAEQESEHAEHAAERVKWQQATQSVIARVEAKLMPMIHGAAEQRRQLEEENDTLRQYIIAKEQQLQ